MCGIAGALSWDGPPDGEAVAAMAARLVHRGPDAGGVICRGPVALGSRRLAIIDLDPRSHQPLADSSGSLWIVHNGEVYNFPDLRRRLESEGAAFRTSSDTEVVLEAYRRWGVDFLDHLNGMFAFALWDDARQRLLLARDRAGEKPLYYQPLPGGALIFASELQALRAHPAASREIDSEAIGQFLSLGYLLTETSILSGVRKLPAAHFLVAERGRIHEPRPYWDLARHFEDKERFSGEREAAEALGELMDDAVRLRLVSDVPLGAFLSGGIDSSTVVESMTRLQPVGRTRTFSIGFPEKSFSELPQAAGVAHHLGVAHSDRVVTGGSAGLLPRIVRSADEPFADTSIVPVYFLAAFAREQVTVCLSGDGGDEIFAGYPTYVADRLHSWLSHVPDPVWRPIRWSVDKLWPVSLDKVSFDYKLRHFLPGLALDPRRAHHSWRTLFNRAEKRELLRPRHRELAEIDGFEVFDRHFQAVAGCHYLDQAMYVDIKTWLVDDILVKVDRATMAHSLESRAPFLDHRLMEFAAALPVAWKLRRLRSKYLLRRVQRRRLPRTVLEQRKLGFNAPVSHWLRNELFERGRAASAGEVLGEWIEPSAVEALWREHREGTRDHGLKLFALTCLALWLAEAG